MDPTHEVIIPAMSIEQAEEIHDNLTNEGYACYIHESTTKQELMKQKANIIHHRNITLQQQLKEEADDEF
jgi:hypothetical protein